MLTEYVDRLRYLKTECSNKAHHIMNEMLYTHGYMRDVVIYWEEVPEELTKTTWEFLVKIKEVEE